MHSLLEQLPDRRRVCVMLRADGWSYEEIAEFLGVRARLVRHELEQASAGYPGLLDHRRSENRNRLMRLVYLMGVSDAGGEADEFPDYLDSLLERSEWLRMRMQAHEELVAGLCCGDDSSEAGGVP